MDPKLRELTYRLIAMAPEAPPFPEEAMVQLEPSPTPAPPARRRSPLVWVGAAAVIALLVVGVPLILFSGDEPGPSTMPPATQTSVPDDVTPTTEPTTTAPITVTQFFQVYLYSDDSTTALGDAALVPVLYSVDLPDAGYTTERGLQEAITSLVQDPVPAGFSSAIPDGTEVLGVRISDAIAMVDLNTAFESGGGSASMFARLRQVVFTATGFAEVDAIEFLIEGEPVEVFSGEGIILDGPQTRADWFDEAQAIHVDIPVIGTTIGSPITIAGTANVFEATLQYEVTTDAGEVLASGFTTATCGTGCWGDFSVDVAYVLDQESPGFVNVFVSSPRDGARENIMSYPVTLLAAESIAAAPELVAFEGLLPGKTVLEPLASIGITAAAVDTVMIDGTPAEVLEAGIIDGVQTYYAFADLTLVPGLNSIEVVLAGTGGTTTETIDVTYAPDAERQIAYLTRVGADEIGADSVQWLTGDEANQAAFEDGVIGSVEEGVPNGYYIRNTNDQLRTLPVADDTLVILQTSTFGSVTGTAVQFDEWLGLFKADGTPWDYEAGDEVPTWDTPHFGYMGASTVYAPYWLTLDADGTVIQIEQQYIP
jgi:hypothetical protein